MTMTGVAKTAASHNAQVGRRGEDLAVQYLTDHGYRVLERNWRCGREGEIDVVALAPGRESTLVVVEVKTRTQARYGTPLEAISFAKAIRLRRLAAAWCQERSPGVRRVRVDAIGVLLEPGSPAQVLHVKDVTA